MTEFVLTAFDLGKYLQEALPALKAAIYRGDLSQVKDILSLYDDTLYGENNLSQTLIEDDYSWVFTEVATDLEKMDPQGALVDLMYPLILVYHHPELFQMEVESRELEGVLDLSVLSIQPGFREGLRAMWEITGFVSPEATRTLYDYCMTTRREKAAQRSEEAQRLTEEIEEGLRAVVERGMGLVVERD